MICSSGTVPFLFQHRSRRTFKSGKLAVDKAEGRMQSPDSAVPNRNTSNRRSESSSSKNVAHNRWRKLFKVFKVSQAFLDLRKSSSESSNDEPNSAYKTPTKPTVDPIYMALKRAHLMASLRGEQFSRSLDLVADQDEDSYDELNAGQSGLQGQRASPNVEQTRLLYSVNQTRTTPSDVGSEANEEEQVSSTEGTTALQEQTSTKEQESPASTLKFQPPVQSSKTKIVGRTKEIRTMKVDAEIEQKAFDRHHYKVPPLKKLYVVMQEKEAAFNEKMKSRKRPDIRKDTYAVIHEFRAKFPGDLDLRPGERLTILDARDPDWWTGYKANEPCGRFPSTSVDRLRLYEQILQVKQNLQLWDDKKKVRIYRDQIVFGQGTMENGFITIRTASNQYINCPVQHLLLIK
ncbi:SH3 1 domain containing protein [Trichuris trichiura]|uniref:SH3 1 domain containing protein n=1 Tax=Trichuris trichiura TaxID=36087 RepID=A0A077Z3Q6_TRITR|nr:SH3 1 domain containing protein [Trichuris trichiura]